MIARWLAALRERLCGSPGGRDRAHAAGLWGEGVAAKHMAGRGMKILGRRVRVGQREEIDLVARDGETLVFVEVKTRASEDFGRPISAVKPDQQRALSRAALRYMRRLRRKPDHFRFDVVEVVGSEGGDPPVVRHIPAAFPLAGRLRVPW